MVQCVDPGAAGFFTTRSNTMALITFSSRLHKDKTVHAVAGSHTQTILTLAKENHIPIDFGCGNGECGTCLVKVSSVDTKRSPMAAR